MQRGTLLTGTDVDGFPVCLFMPDDDEGRAIERLVLRRMMSANLTMNFAVSYEAIMADLTEKPA